jgi:hypothetical protein
MGWSGHVPGAELGVFDPGRSLWDTLAGEQGVRSRKKLGRLDEHPALRSWVRDGQRGNFPVEIFQGLSAV